MLRRHLYGLTLLFSVYAFANAAVNAPITEVVLYPGSATVTRSVAVAAGKSQIDIVGLSSNFDTQTLHAEGSAGLTIGEIVTKDTAKTDATSAGESELEGKIQTLHDQLAVLDAEIHAQEIVKSYLERLGDDKSATDRPGTISEAKRLADIVDTIGRSAKDALLRIQTLTVQKRDVQKKIDALNRDLSRQRSGNEFARTVTISVVADKPGTLTLSYQVNNAGWKPTYRASLNTETSQVDLDRLAVITQTTGEDWTNVSMVLATTRPSSHPVGPEPQPWLLSYFPPQPVVAGIMAAPSPAPAVASVMAPSPAYRPQAKTADKNPMLVEEFISNFDTQFSVPNKVDLLSDGREVTVTLSNHHLAGRQVLRITPNLNTDAILIARSDKAPGIWLNGAIQLIRDGSYVGATTWKPGDDDKFVIPFGRDSLVSVEKIDLKADSGSTGFIDKKAQRQIAYQYKVTNSHKGRVDIEVLVSSPISTSDEIEVKPTLDPRPSTEAWNNKRGVLAWYKNLGSNETAQFMAKYEINYPKDGWVSGF